MTQFKTTDRHEIGRYRARVKQTKGEQVEVEINGLANGYFDTIKDAADKYPGLYFEPRTCLIFERETEPTLTARVTGTEIHLAIRPVNERRPRKYIFDIQDVVTLEDFEYEGELHTLEYDRGVLRVNGCVIEPM